MRDTETVPLVNSRGSATSESVVSNCYRRQRFCVKPGVLFLVLVWNTLVGLSYGVVLNPGGWYLFFPAGSILFIVMFGIIAFLLLLSPLTIIFTEKQHGAKFNKLKVVVFSLLLMVTMPSFGLLLLLIPPITIMYAILFPLSYFIFNANIIQLGVHQLYGPLSENLSIFIHWFVWTQYLGTFVSRLLWSILVCYDNSGGKILLGITIFVSLLAIGVTLCVSRFAGRTWFFQDTNGNPSAFYLICKSLKIALSKQLSDSYRIVLYPRPENECLSRLHVAKQQYGGPFANDSVEDVIKFLKILLVLATLSPVFYMELATDGFLPVLGMHMQGDWRNNCKPAKDILLSSGALAPMIIVIAIPLYMFVRPIICCVPGMLKRVGLGMFVLMLSLVASFAIDTAGHMKNRDTPCMLSVDYTDQTNEYHALNIDSSVLIIPNVLNAVGLMLVYIASYEFICAQSPHSMKGVLIGAFFAIKGLSQLLGVVAILVPFSYINWKPQFPSCGFGYYLVNIILGIIGLVIYTLVACRYRYRHVEQRDSNPVGP